ncbi:MAG: hypothetical protein KF742_01695 [Cryobacterium sp.]|nr:hypothetical protein [Cryobacterium sp.]
MERFGSLQKYAEAVQAFFGVAPKDLTNAFHTMPQSMPVLPDAFRGVAEQHIAKVILESSLRRDNDQILADVPIVKADQSRYVLWKIIYNEANLLPEPELGTTRDLTFWKKKFIVSLQRWGRGFSMEHGFWLTPAGIENYKNSVQVISYAVYNTLVSVALFTLLRCKEQNASTPMSHFARHGFSLNAPTLEEALRRSVNTFGLLNKTQRPSMRLAQVASEEIAAQGGAPPSIVYVPAGLKRYILDRDDLYEYSKRGPEAAARGENGGELQPVLAKAGLKVVEIQPMNVEEGAERSCPLTRPRRVGKFFTMGLHYPELPVEEWRTWKANTGIHNIARDTIEWLSYTDAVLLHSGLWIADGEGRQTPEVGVPYFNSSGDATLYEWLQRYCSPTMYGVILESLILAVRRSGAVNYAAWQAYYRAKTAQTVGRGAGDVGALQAPPRRETGARNVTFTAAGSLIQLHDEQLAFRLTQPVARARTVAELVGDYSAAIDRLRELPLELRDIFLSACKAAIAGHSAEGQADYRTIGHIVTPRGVDAGHRDAQRILGFAESIAAALSRQQPESKEYRQNVDQVRSLLGVYCSPHAWRQGSRAAAGGRGAAGVDVQYAGSVAEVAIGEMTADPVNLMGNGPLVDWANAQRDAIATAAQGGVVAAGDCATAFLKSTPMRSITRNWYATWLALDIVPFIPVLVAQPDIMTDTSCSIWFSPGTAFLPVGMPNFLFTTNTIQKYVTGHFTIYLSGVATNAENCCVLDNIRIRRAWSGHDTSFWNLSDPGHLRMVREGGDALSKQRSLFAIPLLPMEKKSVDDRLFLDITGEVDKRVAEPTALGSVPHYATAPLFMSLVKKDWRYSKYGPDRFFDPEEAPNSILCSGWQFHAVDVGAFREKRGFNHLEPVRPYPGMFADLCGDGPTGCVREVSLMEVMGASPPLFAGARR